MATTLTDYWAEWCPPCKMMNPIIDELEKELPDITIKRIDIDKETDVSTAAGVMSIPTYIIEKDGKETNRIVGATSKANLKKLLE